MFRRCSPVLASKWGLNLSARKVSAVPDEEQLVTNLSGQLAKKKKSNAKPAGLQVVPNPSVNEQEIVQTHLRSTKDLVSHFEQNPIHPYRKEPIELSKVDDEFLREFERKPSISKFWPTVKEPESPEELILRGCRRTVSKLQRERKTSFVGINLVRKCLDPTVSELFGNRCIETFLREHSNYFELDTYTNQKSTVVVGGLYDWEIRDYFFRRDQLYIEDAVLPRRAPLTKGEMILREALRLLVDEGPRSILPVRETLEIGMARLLAKDPDQKYHRLRAQLLLTREDLPSRASKRTNHVAYSLLVKKKMTTQVCDPVTIPRLPVADLALDVLSQRGIYDTAELARQARIMVRYLEWEFAADPDARSVVEEPVQWRQIFRLKDF